MEQNTNLMKKLKVRALTEGDYIVFFHWSKDDVFCSANGWETNRSQKELYKWFINNCVNQVTDNFIRMGIDLDGKLIGYADLAYIKNNSAEIGFAIGESELWGKGIGFHSVLCFINYVYKELGITIFSAETHDLNIRSRKILEKLGFKEISRIGYDIYQGEQCQLIQYQLVFLK
ncbi:GNAT family N-acetyltransferase [Caldibacillus lycopersici]|uniref:GNAT family N-acetyltransferase n=1 Tax=Perspicuibacillus lycopersici TaxID=1325689 RepID=A0AAE3IW19_9BACI|nr:GNAT family N-acetyltransferase [Perspicuibacillus lycopersici]MCU9614658.1 GNAT family N-acetyltransferase [Perspicuibacillus lycopersici]